MNVLADLRIAVRTLGRSKGFVAAGAVTLGLGIAATTTIFSVVYGVLLRPLPYRDPGQLVVIQGEKDYSTGPRIMNYSPAELEVFAGATSVFSSIAMVNTTSLTTRTDAGVEPISGATVSAVFFETLGVPPQLGRAIDGDSDPHIVISDRLWRRLFAGANDALGRSIRFADGENVERVYTVVGVMPPEFQYPRRTTDVWRTLAFARSTGDGNVNNPNRGGGEFIARLRDGATMHEARQDASRANDVLKPQFNASRLDMRAKVTALGEHITGTIGPALWILLAAVSLVLLVACANVANLILARQASRTREMSMRLALGAPRGRLVASLLVESALVSVAGAALGVGAAYSAIRVLQQLQPTQLPRLDAVAVDVPVLIFAAAAALVTALAAGLGPAVLTTRTDAVLAMRAGARITSGRLARRIRSTLVIVEIAASIVLLVGATLLARSLAALLDTDLGVNVENVITAQLDLSLGRSVAGPRQVEIAEALQQRVAAIPSVSAVGFGTGLPPTGEFMRVSFVLGIGGGERVSHMVTSVPASPGYFSALQIPLIKGRLFTDADRADSAALSVIVNREAAKRFFGDDDPIGRTLPMGSDTMHVVGVVENVKYTGVDSPPEGVIYRPFGQSPFRLMILVARTTGDPAAVAAELRQVIRTYDPDISIGAIQPLTTWVSDAVAQPRFRALLLVAIAGITLLLAVIGLYSVVSYATIQRTTEIGVRMAVGARQRDVLRLVVGGGARLALIGTAIGVIAAYFAARILSAFLYGVSSTDPVSFAIAATALVTVALVASYLPARRAARVDPVVALRAE